MVTPPEGPFASYQPPPLDAMFSESGKLAIVAFKTECLIETVRDAMLAEDMVEPFVSGGYFGHDYDGRKLDNLLEDSADRISFAEMGVAFGVKMALLASGIPLDEAAIGIHSEKRNEHIITVTTRFFPRD